jgi:uncharacterized protein (DUF2147 family)
MKNLIQTPAHNVRVYIYEESDMGLSLCFGICLWGINAATPPEITPLGYWARADGIAKVHIAPCGNDLCATNIWVRPGTKGEKVGDVLIMKIAPKSHANWVGRGFDPQRNLHYRLDLKLAPDNMTTKGCVLGGIICRQVGWQRL